MKSKKKFSRPVSELREIAKIEVHWFEVVMASITAIILFAIFSAGSYEVIKNVINYFTK